MSAAELAIAGGTQALQRKQDADIDPFEPQDWKGLLALADMVSKTDFAPKDFRAKPEACAIAMLYGKQLGVPALQALQNVCVINGRPSAYGDLFWAVILSQPDLEDVEEQEGDNQATVTLKRRGRKPRTVTFTQQDAVTAGLWKKAGPWTQYPKAMLLWRARTICGKAVFPDRLKGITSSYEAEDSGAIIDATPLPSGITPDQAMQSGPSVAAPQKITHDTARNFAHAWKQSGYTIAQAKEKIKEISGVESSLDVTTDKVEDLMRWATKNPNWPNPTETSTDEKLCRQIFEALSYDLAKQAHVITKFTKEGATDWVAMSFELNKELPEDK